MQKYHQFYIDGSWVDAHSKKTLAVINPATEQAIAEISMGDQTDVERAVAAATKAFPSYSNTSVKERIELLESIAGVFEKRSTEVAAAITAEMGAPKVLSESAQAMCGLAHVMTGIELLKSFQFETKQGTTLLRKEPIGVCGLITPWNWPINQIASKVIPALSVGCTMVLKPSEIAPINAILFAEILHEAGCPKGVFNLVNGDGPTVGALLSSLPEIDMVSFTGSTRAGKQVAINAAATVKRVSQELGGKSAHIVLDDADATDAANIGIGACYLNNGQSCNAPARMLVPANRQDEIAAAVAQVVANTQPGDPTLETTALGPQVSLAQWEKVQGLIQTAIDEGAELVCGGVGKPEGLETGYFTKPTVFKNVNNQMTIAREEIFGPVLTIIPYNTVEEAIDIANDTIYGLSGRVTSANKERAVEVAKQIRSGNVHINDATTEFMAPFGGYKQSGNGREWGVFGLEEFLEVKAILGAV